MRKPLLDKSLILLSLWFYLAIQEGICQNYRIEFDKYTIDQGLSQNTVYCILQDSKGYLWFGTEDGLNRFDGYNFTVFLPSKGNSATLSNSRVMALYEDMSHNIWVGTLGGGINRYQYDTQEFTSYTYNQNNPESIGSNVIMSLAGDSYGQILVGTAGAGLSIFNPTTESSKNYSHNPYDSHSIPGNLVRSLKVTSEGAIYVGTDKGLALFDSELDQFFHISQILGTDNQIFSKTVLSIAEAQNGNLWICIEDYGLIEINTSEINYIHYTSIQNTKNSLASNIVIDIFIDDMSIVWLATYEGLQRFNPQTNSWATFKNDPFDDYSISSNLVRSIYEDNTGAIWIGTYRDGLNKFNRKYQKFTPIRNQIATKNNLPSSSIRALGEDIEGNIIIGTYGHGLVSIHPQTFSIISNPFPEIEATQSFLKYVSAIATDSQSNLWVGFDGDGLFKYNEKTKVVKRYSNDQTNKESIASDRIRCLHIDSKGNLWVGTTGDGVSILHSGKETFTTFRPNPFDPNNSLSQERIICILEDSHESIWLGTSSDGLNLFNPRTQKFSHFKHRPDDTLSISSNRILSLHQDTKSRLWIGTGAGLNLFDYNTKTFKSFHTSDGLPNDVIYGILEDDQGNLWLSTNKGLCSFEYQNSQKPIVRNFSKREGLQSDEFTEGAYYKSRSGLLVFGGIGGINIFDPSSIILNPTQPKVHIEKLTYFKNERKTGQRKSQTIPVYNLKSIKLPYIQNNVSLHFIALHYSNPSNNVFKYQLEGFDTEWITPELGQRNATYTNLSPGTYNFKVIAASSDGVWSETGASLKLTIEAPYWLRWWFIGILLVSVIGLIILIIRQRTASLIRMQKELEAKVKNRTKEILQQKEEIQSQRDHLSELNAELQQKNEEILTQHEELERAQKQLIQSEKMASIGVLTAGIAHEINNPVNFVYAGVNSVIRDFQDIDQVLQEIIAVELKHQDHSEVIKHILAKKVEFDFDEAYNAIKQTLKDIKMGAERTTEIVEGLKNFAHTENEEWIATDINKIIEGVLILLKNEYKNRIEINKDLSPNLPLVECKRGRINQVIMNIISNAIDAIIDKGAITINTIHNNNKCIITISDTGTGIEEKNLDRIFDPFFTTKKIGKGMGLGLSISYGIVQEHNGQIIVDSNKEKGTRFVIELPLKQNG